MSRPGLADSPVMSYEMSYEMSMKRRMVVDLQLSATTSVLIAVAKSGRALAPSLHNESYTLLNESYNECPEDATRAKFVTAKKVTTRDYPTLKLKSKQTNKERKNLLICKQTSAADR